MIVLGVILIIVFSSINSGLSTSLSVRPPLVPSRVRAASDLFLSSQLHRLHLLWGRGGFVLYFLVQIVTLFLAWTSVLSLTRILENRTSEVDELDPSRVSLVFLHLGFSCRVLTHLSPLSQSSSLLTASPPKFFTQPTTFELGKNSVSPSTSPSSPLALRTSVSPGA